MKRIYVKDIRRENETLMVFSRCNGYRDVYILQKADGSFIRRGAGILCSSDNKIQPRILRKGCLVKVVNPYNEFYGKKLSVYAINGEMITLLTHAGKMTVSAGTLKVVK